MTRRLLYVEAKWESLSYAEEQYITGNRKKSIRKFIEHNCSGNKSHRFWDTDTSVFKQVKTKSQYCPVTRAEGSTKLSQ